MKLSLFKNVRDTQPVEKNVKWFDFINRARNPLVRANKDGQLFSPGIFKTAQRLNENVEKLTMVVLDLDHDVPEIRDIQTRVWESLKCAHVIHSTHSHLRVTESNPKAERRLRMVIPLKAPVPASKFHALRRYVIEVTQLPADKAASALAQMYHTPVKASHAPYEFLEGGSEPLDWQDLPLSEPEVKETKQTILSGNGTPPPTVNEMIEKVLRSKSGPKFASLLAGNTAGYDSHSEADQAFCSMLGFWDPTGVLIDEAFRGSRLYRPKWDAKHNGDGRSYGQATIQKALSGCSKFYDWTAHSNGNEKIDANLSKGQGLAREATGHSDEETLQRLAMLPPLEYERERLTAAKTLKCRPATLDKLVAAQRPNAESLQGRELNLPEVEPWPDPVNGAEVLNGVSTAFARFIALPPGAADVLAAWSAHAHVVDAFDVSPRLNYSSPERGCGKTTGRDVTGLFVPRALATENLSVAVLFRIIESHKPTLLADECDAWLSDNEELRGLLNAGHRRGGQALRCEGEGNEVRAFNVFGPAVLCGIGSLPGTLHDRSIEIRLNRAKPGELLTRFDSRHTEREQELCRKLARWCVDNYGQIESCDPILPASAYNRVADNWRPLFKIATVAGGDWPERLSGSFAKLSKTEADEQGLGIMLLADIKQTFDEASAEKLFSKTLVAGLIEMSDRPWGEARRDKPITPAWLSNRLRPFGILPKSIRIETENLKGYTLVDFQEAFTRYLPDQGVSSRHSVTEPINIDENEKHNRHNETTCDGSETHESLINTGLRRRDALKAPVGAIVAERERYEPVFTPERQAELDSWEEGAGT